MNFSKAFDLVPHSSNVNEVIMAVLNSFFFFLRKDFARTKSTKVQRRNQAKAQNATREQK